MTSKRQTLKRIESIIARELFPEAPRKGISYAWPLKDRFSGWLALNTIMGGTDDLVGINPIIGVLAEDVEDVVRRYSGCSRSGMTPTISVSLGYLMPEKKYLEWRFGPLPDCEMEDEVQKLIGAIRVFGMPFVESTASLPHLVRDLETLRFTYKESAVYRLPAAYLVMGDSDRARQYVEQQVTALGERTDKAANEYRQFGMAFLSSALGIETHNS
jgi:hypothetical protein